jgi:hypothetical protein
MRLKSAFLLAFVFLFCSEFLFSQTINNPNMGLKSHETLEIQKVDLSRDNTVIFLSVENRIEGGAFCADKNIYIIDPKGKKLMLKKSSGIPVCPDSYKFKHIGEKLDFILTFPPLQQGTAWIDLVEDCNDNCFSMYGIILDNKLNQSLDEAFRSAESNEPAKALVSFTKIAGSSDIKNDGVAGLLYINIVRLAKETGNAAKATEWYNKLKTSSIPRASLYLKYLNDQGISY